MKLTQMENNLAKLREQINNNKKGCWKCLEKLLSKYKKLEKEIQDLKNAK